MAALHVCVSTAVCARKVKYQTAVQYTTVVRLVGNSLTAHAPVARRRLPPPPPPPDSCLRRNARCSALSRRSHEIGSISRPPITCRPAADAPPSPGVAEPRSAETEPAPPPPPPAPAPPPVMATERELVVGGAAFLMCAACRAWRQTFCTSAAARCRSSRSSIAGSS
jgi:hypothetical protein